MRVVTYSRVSTDHHSQNPQVQVDELRNYCAARGWKIEHEIIDHGFTGKNERRPGLKQLIDLVRSRRVDLVVVSKLDRLARSIKHLIGMLEEFDDLNIKFISVKDQIDMTTASGRLLLHLIAAFSEFEVALVRERTLAGLAHARSKGKKLGRPRNSNYEIISSLREQGLTYTEIEKRLGCERSAIYRALKAMAKTQSRSAFQISEKTRHGKCS